LVNKNLQRRHAGIFFFIFKHSVIFKICFSFSFKSVHKKKNWVWSQPGKIHASFFFYFLITKLVVRILKENAERDLKTRNFSWSNGAWIVHKKSKKCCNQLIKIRWKTDTGHVEPNRQLIKWPTESKFFFLKKKWNHWREREREKNKIIIYRIVMSSLLGCCVITLRDIIDDITDDEAEIIM
jgi:hypothetical protein